MKHTSQSLEGEPAHLLTMQPRRNATACVLTLLLLAMFTPVQGESTSLPTVEITAYWYMESSPTDAHAYMLTFSDNGTFSLEVDLSHHHENTSLPASYSLSWGSEEGKRIAILVFNTTLSWGDEITLEIHIIEHDGESVDIETRREFVVGVWNQPMDDHEIMLSSSWSLEQSYSDGIGAQRFALEFYGQGWQQRVGEVLSSWELGNGSFATLETTLEGQTDLNLILSQVWKNETIIRGHLTDQIFDAQGFGTMNTTVIDGAMETVVTAEVSRAALNRSLLDGVIGEKLLLEATGTIAVFEDGLDNNSMTIDGELAVFFFAYEDVDGVRVLQHTQFEAMADLILISDGTRLDVSLDGFRSLERWEAGSRTEQLEELYGKGTFGFTGQDDNASLQVNGTILDLHTKVENGTTSIDDLHVDGILTGDVQGTFGILRSIETTGTQTNSTGSAFLVNVIFQESWFNITGVNGGNFFDGAGIGATHNESWEYQVVNADWEDRTIRLVWRETGPDASEGDELLDNTPTQLEPTPPASEEGLGNLTVGRETGLMPIPMMPNDQLRLLDQDGITLTIKAGASRIDTRDGHNLTVIDWLGSYGGQGDTGEASGAIVTVGPLSGLLSVVNRSLALPFGDQNETVLLYEMQHLERILSPEIVGEDENHAPDIVSIGLREGLLFSEGGSFAHLEVMVTDGEWNVVSVIVDASSLGSGILTLNDRGLNGDYRVGDDVYTTVLLVGGLEVGELNLTVTAEDSFGRTTTSIGHITVVNQAPRLLSVEFAPDGLERGKTVVVNARAYDGHGVESVSVDLREYGGDIINLTLADGVWAAMIPLPFGLSPGQQSLLFITTDNLGAKALYRTFSPATQGIGNDIRGPHFIVSASQYPIQLLILNDRPLISAENLKVEKQTNDPTRYTVRVQDPDGIERVQINLGLYAPIGVTSWVSMYDDGQQGGDEVAGDGVYSVLLSIREGTPLGSHEVTIRSFDIYGELNSTTAMIELVEANLGTTSENSQVGLMVISLGVIVLFAAGLVLFVLWRRQDGNGESQDRFGQQ